MLVKRIGYFLIVKSKLYKLISITAPILMIACLLLVYIVPDITQSYKFQQPALRTKVSTIYPINAADRTIQFQAVYPGIGLSIIHGRLSHESVLLVSKCDSVSIEIFGNVYQTILRNNRVQKKLMAKNVGFLCYNSTQSIQSFMKYQTGTVDHPQHHLWNQLGIIRNALVFSFQPETAARVRKPRVFFNIYSPQSQSRADLDYYQAIKQLLQQVGVSKWQPCRQIEESKLISTLIKATRSKAWNFSFKHVLCQLHEISRMGKKEQRRIWPQLNKVQNINHIFQERGIQAGTIDVNYHKSNQSDVVQQMSRVGLSFLEEFVVFEDHLHSSSTLYLPLTQADYIPIKALVIPGLAYLVVTAAYLIIKAVNILNLHTQKYNQNVDISTNSSLQPQQIKATHVNPIVILLLMTAQCLFVEYYLNRTLFLTILSASLVRFNLKSRLSYQEKEITRIILAGMSILLCQYYAIFCFPLSLLLIFLTNILCFASKPVAVGIVAIGLIGLMHFGQLGFIQLIDEITGSSAFAQITMLPLMVWILVV